MVLTIIDEFRPRLIVVSAGFDGFLGENVTTLRLSEAFFAHAGATLSCYSFAMIFESGYSIDLDRGLPAFIKVISSEKRLRLR